VRIRIALRRPGSSRVIETSALVNSGFEVDVPQLVLPVALARELGFDIEGAPTEAITVCGGAELPMRILGVVEVKVVVPDRPTGWVRAVAVSVGEEEEVLLSDKLTDALSVSPVLVGAGIWRFTDEPPDVRRMSVKPEFWREGQNWSAVVREAIAKKVREERRRRLMEQKDFSRIARASERLRRLSRRVEGWSSVADIRRWRERR